MKIFIRTNLLWIYAIVFLAIVVNVSWMSDDALITMRHVLNFVNGYGPVFNIGERVQAYTHPLWFILISLLSFLFNYVYVTFVVSFFLSFFAIYILFKFTKRVSKSNANFKLTIAWLCIIFSKAYIDFSSSGLENPLSHFLLLLFFILYFSIGTEIQNKNPFSSYKISFLVLISSLIYLTRMDHIIIIIPSLVALIVNLYKNNYGYKNFAKLLLIPLFLIGGWHLFSLVYYGFLFPNTAYAKLGTGILYEDYLLQGLTYLYYVLKSDPITILVIILALFSAFDKKDNLIPSFGVFLYCCYILKIGGDFMGGRFFSAPFIVSLLLIMRLEYKQRLQSRKFFVIITLCIFAFNTFHKNILNSTRYLAESSNSFYYGIADERAYYVMRGLGFFDLFDESSSLANLVRAYNDWNYNASKRNFVPLVAIGYYSIIKGPSTYVFDYVGLSEPLLSKMPTISKTNFRIGHFFRSVPSGYINTLLTGSEDNLITDKKISIYYSKLRNAISGEILTIDRFKDIIDLNLNPLVSFESNDIFVNGLDYAKTNVPNGTPWYNINCIAFNNEQRVIFSFEEPQTFSSIDVTIDSNDAYEFMINGESYNIAPLSDNNYLIYTKTLVFDKLLNFPEYHGNGVYTVPLNFGHLFKNVKEIVVKSKDGDDHNSICSLVVNRSNK